MDDMLAINRVHVHKAGELSYQWDGASYVARGAEGRPPGLRYVRHQMGTGIIRSAAEIRRCPVRGAQRSPASRRASHPGATGRGPPQEHRGYCAAASFPLVRRGSRNVVDDEHLDGSLSRFQLEP